MRVVQLTIFLLAVSLSAAPSQWFVARSPHFEVYSDAGPAAATRTLSRFEELRSFFDRNQILGAHSAVKQRPPIRVIAFNSRSEYSAFKVRPTADAYYTATEDRDYIVLPILETAGNFGIAAHEYAHFVLYSRSLKLPSWLSEGIAELFSTVTISTRGCEFGGPLRARVDVLRRHPWFDAALLLTARPDELKTREQLSLFYAESWAVTDMLNASPEYGPHFSDLIAALSTENADQRNAFARTYGKSPDAVLRDAKEWIASGRSSRRVVPPVASEPVSVPAEALSDRQSRILMADLLFANGEWARSEESYRALLAETPNDAELLASLGTIALRQDRKPEAAVYFRRALDNHLSNAALCYRYALVADELSMPPEEIERALQRAIAVQPDFDDARYKLALIESNQGNFSEAVADLQRMAKPSGARAYGYWTAMAFALSELDRHDEAKSAAGEALQCATTAEERTRARQLAYIAGTDMTVRFERDAHGNLQLVTTRVPHGTADFNPFIEPGDRIETANGQLKEIQCKEGRLTGLLVESESGTLTLSVPDPLHVMIRNGPAQVYCGPQSASIVKVEYAAAANPASGVLRGIEFH